MRAWEACSLLEARQVLSEPTLQWFSYLYGSSLSVQLLLKDIGQNGLAGKPFIWGVEGGRQMADFLVFCTGEGKIKERNFLYFHPSNKIALAKIQQ